MAMPMLTFVNKLKAYNYETNIEEMMLEPEFWDNTIPYDEWDKWYYENVRIKPMGDQTFNSGLSIGFDTRASITYNKAAISSMSMDNSIISVITTTTLTAI